MPTCTTRGALRRLLLGMLMLLAPAVAAPIAEAALAGGATKATLQVPLPVSATVVDQAKDPVRFCFAPPIG